MADERRELNSYLNDMLGVERELHGAFRRHKRDEHVQQYTAAKRVVDEAEDRIDRHIAALEDAVRRYGGESTAKKAVGAVMGAAAGLLDKARDDKVSRILRDDYTALSFASVCYEMLHTTALAMQDAATADLALRHLRDYTPMVMQIGEVLPGVITDELTREGKVSAAPGAADQAVRNTRSAWSEASPEAGAA